MMTATVCDSICRPPGIMVLSPAGLDRCIPRVSYGPANGRPDDTPRPVHERRRTSGQGCAGQARLRVPIRVSRWAFSSPLAVLFPPNTAHVAVAQVLAVHGQAQGERQRLVPRLGQPQVLAELVAVSGVGAAVDQQLRP